MLIKSNFLQTTSIPVGVDERTTAIVVDMAEGHPIRFLGVRLRYSIDSDGNIISLVEQGPEVRREYTADFASANPELANAVKILADASEKWALEDAAATAQSPNPSN